MASATSSQPASPRVEDSEHLSNNIPRDSFEQTAEVMNSQKFSSSQALSRSLEHHRQALLDDKTHDQYLVFTSVPKVEFSKLSDDSCKSNKFCRFSYNSKTETLIAKIMPSPEHDIAAGSFQRLVDAEILAMELDDEVDTMNTTTVTIGNWKKQADCCWAPAAGITELSLVVEVGLSESARRLAIDARGWLEGAGSLVKIVLTIEINRQQPQITISQWQMGPRQCDIETRISSGSACRTSSIDIHRNNNTTVLSGGTELRLEFEKVVGRSPAGLPEQKHFTISQSKLQKYAEKVWRKQRFL